AAPRSARPTLRPSPAARALRPAPPPPALTQRRGLGGPPRVPRHSVADLPQSATERQAAEMTPGRASGSVRARQGAHALHALAIRCAGGAAAALATNRRKYLSASMG